MQDSVQDRRQQRAAFFAMLVDNEHPLELRYRLESGAWRKAWAATPEDADDKAHRLTTFGHDVYVGMAPRLGVEGDDQRAYAASNVLWVDCDTARSVHKLGYFDPEPTAVVLSGGRDGNIFKRHATWRLTEPLPADQVKRHNQRLQHHLEADAASVDAARVLRVPGSRSHKTGRVATLEFFTGEMVDLQALTGVLEDSPDYQPPDEIPKAKTTDELVDLFINTSLGENEGRHDAFRSVCGVLLRRCIWIPPDVLFELAACWAERHLKPCRDRAELERQFDNVLARELDRRGIAI